LIKFKSIHTGKEASIAMTVKRDRKMKVKNTLLKMIHCSCLLFIIVFGLMAIIGSNGGGGDGDNGNGGTTDSTPPSVPASLTATAVSSNQIDLSWAATTESDLAGYNIYRSTTSGSGFSKINTSLVTGASYVDTGLTSGTTYYYKITAEDTSDNESGYSSEVNATPTVDESLNLIVNEDFEIFSAETNITELGANWIVYSEEDGDYVCPIDIDDTVYASGNKSLKMRSYGDRKLGGTGVLFNQSSDVTIIEASLRIDNSITDEFLFGIMAIKGMDDNTGGPIGSLSVGFMGDEIFANSIKTGKTYSLNTWVKLKMKIDTNNNKFTVWVNDEATSSATTNADLTSQGAITGFWIGLYKPDTLTTLNGWIDDIKIYQGQ